MNEIRKQLGDVIPEIAAERFGSYAQGTEVQITPFDPGDGMEVKAHGMAVLIVSNSKLRVTLSTHYTPSELKSLTAQLLGHTEEDTTEDDVAEFVKEYCNLVAGQLKDAFSDVDVTVEISIPWITRGFDAIFVRAITDPKSYVGSWSLAGTFGKIIIDAGLELDDESVAELFKEAELKKPSRDTIEFM